MNFFNLSLLLFLLTISTDSYSSNVQKDHYTENSLLASSELKKDLDRCSRIADTYRTKNNDLYAAYWKLEAEKIKAELQKI